MIFRYDNIILFNMKKYNIRGGVYGGEIVIGKISETFRNYWYSRSDSELQSYLFSADWEYEGGEKGPVMYEGENLYWHEIDDILHFNGSHSDGPIYVMDEETGDETKLDVVESEWSREGGYVITEEPDWESLPKGLTKDDFQPVLACMSHEKGWMNNWVLELDGQFDSNKLTIGVLETEFGEFIEKMYYDGKELEDTGYDSTTGKGFSVILGWFVEKWHEPLENVISEDKLI